jgi:hypothetical protein
MIIDMDGFERVLAIAVTTGFIVLISALTGLWSIPAYPPFLQ